MRPVLFEIPLGFRDVPVHAYGFFIMLGFVVGSWIAARRAPRVGVSPEFTLDLSLWVMIAGIVGSRVFYVAQYHQTYSWGIFDITDGNLNFGAGVLGWLLPLAWYQWKSRDPGRPRRGLLGSLLGTVFACFVCGVVLARAAYLLQHRARIGQLYGLDPFGVFKIWNGGIVFYGGLFGAVATAFWYIRRHKQSIAVVSDLFIPQVALGYAFARVGCFLNGCCFGKPTDLPWGVTYPGPTATIPSGSPAWQAQVDARIIDRLADVTKQVHPSQLYAVVCAVAIFFILSAIWRTNKVPGRVLAWFCLLYPVYRFLVEMTRGDEAHDWFGLSISQFISIPVFAAGGLYLWILTRPVTQPSPSVAAVPDRR